MSYFFLGRVDGGLACLREERQRDRERGIEKYGANYTWVMTLI